jgi:hypothetical protein
VSAKAFERLAYSIVGVLILSFLGLLFYAADKDHKEQQIIKDGCIKTEMYVLGGRNRSVNPVYDCTGVDLKSPKR